MDASHKWDFCNGPDKGRTIRTRDESFVTHLGRRDGHHAVAFFVACPWHTNEQKF